MLSPEGYDTDAHEAAEQAYKPLSIEVKLLADRMHTSCAGCQNIHAKLLDTFSIK